MAGVLYFSMPCTPDSRIHLDRCLTSLLAALPGDGAPPCLYRLYYEQSTGVARSTSSRQTFEFQASPPDLVFHDSILDAVRDAWRFAMGPAADDLESEYMKFEDREGMGDDENVYD